MKFIADFSKKKDKNFVLSTLSNTFYLCKNKGRLSKSNFEATSEKKVAKFPNDILVIKKITSQKHNRKLLKTHNETKKNIFNKQKLLALQKDQLIRLQLQSHFLFPVKKNNKSTEIKRK